MNIVTNFNIDPELSFIIGGVMIALGLYFITRSNKIVAPLDKLLVSISKKTNRPYSTIKLLLDIILTSFSILTIIILNLDVPITIYSIIISVSIGFIIKFFENVINIKI